MNNTANTQVKSQSLYYHSLNKTLKTTKRRYESVDKYSLTPSSNFCINDRETMMEEMSQLLREIKAKTREFKQLSQLHSKVESDNSKLIQKVEGLIAECRQIPHPIEKNTSTIQINLSKRNTLQSNLQEKLSAYQQELASKDNYLNELKSNDLKILRMYEIEGRLLNANEQYEQIYLQYAELVKIITKLELESQRANEETAANKLTAAKIEKEKRELKEKIRLNKKDNTELDHKEKFYTERINAIRSKFAELKSNLKQKSELVKAMKEKMANHRSLVTEKEKSDSMLASQLKQIQLLKEKRNRASNHIRELEKTQSEYISKINHLKANAQPMSNAFLAIQKELAKRNDELASLKHENKHIKELNQELMDRLNSRSFSIHKQISYNLNIPLKLDLDFDNF